MVELLYQLDSYKREFNAPIIDLDQNEEWIGLHTSIFYPGGGGQPSDQGKLVWNNQSLTIRKVQKRNDLILHYYSGSVTPPIGTIVRGELDWDRRYQLMRTHTAMHILCGVIYRDYGATVTGGDMDPLKGRMDFEFERMGRELIDKIESAVNLEVEKCRPIRVNILPRDEAFKIPDLIRTKINLLPEGITQVRTVEIVGLDLQADGGTHVNNTIEVGAIKVTDYKSKGKINKRIYIELSG